MRTIIQIKGEIQGIETRIKRGEYKGNEKSKLYKQIENLRACILYLETEPRAEFVGKESEDLNKIIQRKQGVIDDFFGSEEYQKMTKSALSKLKKEHEKTHNLPKLRTQLDTLNYLLS
jgi:cation transport regulator ChaC